MPEALDGRRGATPEHWPLASVSMLWPTYSCVHAHVRTQTHRQTWRGERDRDTLGIRMSQSFAEDPTIQPVTGPEDKTEHRVSVPCYDGIRTLCCPAGHFGFVVLNGSLTTSSLYVPDSLDNLPKTKKSNFKSGAFLLSFSLSSLGRRVWPETPVVRRAGVDA